ncbi:MAG: Gldg family protein [Planctomycetes bacterium]|nr:Gldg family protein [Planctomycetota bacterium]
MKNLYALTRRELGSLFLAPSLHAMTTVFVFIYGFYLMVVINTEQTASFDSLALFVCFFSILVVPLITMRCFSEEMASGTIELLLTAPVRVIEVVISKFIGAFVFFLATIAPLFVHACLLAYCGKLDWGTTAAQFVGLVLLGATFVSIGLFASCRSNNQIVAAGTAVGINMALVMLAALRESATGFWKAVGYLSFVPHFQRTFVLGVIDTRAIVYFITMPIGMLFLTWLMVSSRGLATRKGNVNRFRSFLVGGGILGAGMVAVGLICYLDVTGIGVAKASSFIGGIFSGPVRYVFEFAVILGVAYTVYRWRNKQNRDMLSAFIAGIAVVVILVNINFLAQYPFGTFKAYPWPLSSLAHLQPKTWDISETSVNSLSPDAEKALDELSERVDIVVFYSSIVDYNGVKLLDETRRLMEKFSSYSSLVRVQYIDAELERAKALPVARDMGLEPKYLNQAAVVSYRGRRTIVPAGMAISQPEKFEQMMGKKDYSFSGEQAFTVALKRLLDPRTVRVYFSDGHGEYRLGDTKAEARSVGRFANMLSRNENLAVNKIFLQGQDIPRDCDVLVLPGPEIPLGADVIMSIKKYIEGGGRVLFLLPFVDQSRGARANEGDKDLAEFLKSMGGAPRGDMVFEDERRTSRSSLVPGLVSSANSMTSGSGQAVQLILQSPQSIIDNPDVEKSGWVMERLVMSTDTARSIRKNGDDVKYERGPFTLGFTAARAFGKERLEARVIVIGNVEFISNLSLDYGHNKEFATSSIHWLSGRDYKINIKGPEYVDRKLKMTPYQMRMVGWVALIWLPMVWLVLALSVWWVRKQ